MIQVQSEAAGHTPAESPLGQHPVTMRAVLDSLPAAIAVLNGSGRIELVNQAWERLARENADPALAHTGVGQNYRDIVRRAKVGLAGELSQVLAGLEAVLCGAGPGFSFEYPWHSPSEQRWYLMRVIPMAGSQPGAVVSHEEITERKQTEQTQREALGAASQSEARFRALWESAADAMVLSDAAGIVLAANPAYANLYGYPLDEVIGRHFAIIFPEEARAWAGEQYNLIFADLAPSQAFESVIWRADGQERIVESRIEFVVENGQRTGMLSIIRDVTVRKKAEESQKFLAEVSQILAGSLDYEQTVQAVTHLAVPRLADWCVLHLTGEGPVRLEIAGAGGPLADSGRVAQAMEWWQAHGPGGAEHDVDHVLHAGTTALVGDLAEPSRQTAAQDDEPVRTLWECGLRSYLIVPLHVRGRTLGAMTWLTAKPGHHFTSTDLALAEEVASRSAQAIDNAQLYALSQEALRGRDEFLSIVSHDLKNPLMAITGYSQLLHRRLDHLQANDLETFYDGLAHIDAAAGRILGLVNQLLDVGRLQAGGTLVLYLQPTDLGQMVEQVVAEHKPQANGHDIRLVRTGEELVGIWDTERLERVIGNIVANAAKYSPDGGQILLHLAREANWATLSVQDWGMGIPSEGLPHIFERFHRARNVAGRIPGTGIGLSSARHTIEQHGGTIEVVSQEGRGSTFTIHLPLA